MSVYLYDEALITDLRNRFRDSRISIVPPDEFFRFAAQINPSSDSVCLPAVSLMRPSWALSDSRPYAMKFDGALVSISKDKSILTNVLAIPIRISYQIDVWTYTRRENDDILRELIFYYSTHPTLKITVPYGLDNFEHTFNIIYDSEIADNSDIVDFQNTGRYFRQTLSLYTDDAYLWNSKTGGKVTIDSVSVCISDTSNGEECDNQCFA